MYAKIHFERSDIEYEENQTDHDRLLTSVMEAFNRYFPDYRAAAMAQKASRQLRTEFNSDPTVTMFGVLEDFKAAQAARPDAGKWAAFRREATTAIKPYFFTMEFIDG